jgi:hypothetical protein
MFGVRRLEKVSTGMRRLRAVTEKLEARHGELEDFPNETWSFEWENQGKSSN